MSLKQTMHNRLRMSCIGLWLWPLFFHYSNRFIVPGRNQIVSVPKLNRLNSTAIGHNYIRFVRTDAGSPIHYGKTHKSNAKSRPCVQ